jgi:predicted unusual protein kinase regulating ubiquinone biosynthesis (AarF/ABC1/UbiB family)
MKEQASIPTSKVERAGQFVKTGVKIGGNFIKHYARNIVDPTAGKAQLHEDNATDIYASLANLKGSALKVAQMMSMDRTVLPRAYQQRFQMSQYSAPPLSLPLVVKTFQKYLGKSPFELFDSFSEKALHAASIGQVHEAWKDGRRYAVKVQYPGVADSISSDLKMVKPFAVQLMGLNEADVNRYMSEVEAKLMEETDYELELRRGQSIAEACRGIEGLLFPQYYPEYSCGRILTMDWMVGQHLPEFLATSPSQEVRNRAGQLLWDFYELQIHHKREVHADPHPGNFLLQPDGRVGVIDFGCVKEIPDSFYYPYFGLINQRNLRDAETTDRIFRLLEFLYATDSPKDVAFYTELFSYMIGLLGRPFFEGHFDFGQDGYFDEIYAFGEKLANMKELKESKVARGSKDSLYINRTYYGLYSILNQLKAQVNTESVSQKIEF